jgi:ADP-ribose pyrophosphatase
MSDRETLDGLPTISVEVVADHSATVPGDHGFLRMRRLTLRNRYEDGSESETYRYDLVDRAAMDAVAIVLVAGEGEGCSVCLRSALRPPLAFRGEYAIPLPEPAPNPVQWELPAGLIEPEERGESGIRACAAREALEEVGIELAPEAFSRLGPAATLTPGVLGEKVHFVVARVDPSRRGIPTEDGSPVEERAEVRFVPLADALAAARDGRLGDVKTEVGLRRLAEQSR